MKRIYAVNTTNEPDLTKSFTQVTKKHKVHLESFRSKDLSFFYHRPTDTVEIFHDGKKIDLSAESYFFLRKWGPNKSSSTLLSVILESLKIPFLDSGINTYQDARSSKITQTFEAPQHNVRFPTSWAFTRENINKGLSQSLKTFTFPVVLKTMGAGRGRHVWKCNSKTDLIKKIRYAKKQFDRDLYLIQEYIPNESDIRVIVFEGKIVSAIERRSNNGFYNNISQGGSGRVVPLTPEEQGIAKRAAKMAKLDLAGVDIVRTKYGPLLFEINKAPDLKCFNEIVGYNIAEEIAMRIVKKRKV